MVEGFAVSKPSLENNSLRRRSYPLSRGGIALRLDCVSRGERTEKQILLTHGVTYSSHEFDVDYEDYSLVRCLAGAGYGVWRLDGDILLRQCMDGDGSLVLALRRLSDAFAGDCRGNRRAGAAQGFYPERPRH